MVWSRPKLQAGFMLHYKHDINAKVIGLQFVFSNCT
jgi:hypothetical protein